MQSTFDHLSMPKPLYVRNHQVASLLNLLSWAKGVEVQENLMSKRIQDLTNKLLVSEKTVRQLKERKHSRKHSLARQQATQSDSGATDAWFLGS